MKLLDSYLASLKSLAVEEPIDLYVHRPLGFLVAKASFPTPISPDFITLLSIFVGVGGGLVLLTSWPHKMMIAGVLIFAATVLDCADGQLARMRKTSSPFGRMIDGTADLLVIGTVAPLSIYVVWQRHNTPTWLSVTVLAMGVLTMVTSSFHTSMYDHFKNVYLKFTQQGYTDGEDYETAFERWKSTRDQQSWWKRISWRIYLFYVGSQRDFVRKYDPWTTMRFSLLPAFDPARGEIYRKHAEPLMRVWRSFFGVGSLVFGLAVFNFIDQAEILLVFRLIVLNAIFYLYLRPAQRRASRAAFQEMGLRMPDQPEIKAA